MKVVNGRYYIHKSLLHRFPDVKDIHDRVYAGYLDECLPDVISIPVNHIGHISFIEVSNFDTDPEPTLASYRNIKLPYDMRTRANDVKMVCFGKNPPVYHGKELMVDPSYTGFDINAAKARREHYLTLNPDKLRMGRYIYWKEFCETHGI